MKAVSGWDSLLRALLESTPADVDDGGYVPHTLRLSTDALEVLHAWEAEIEKDLGPGGRLSCVEDWASKLVGNSIRVAALLHLARTADDIVADLWGGEISKWAMEGAIELARALSTHALRVFDSLDADPKRALLRYVLRRIRELPPEERNLRRLREVCRGKREIDTSEDVQDLVDELVKRNWVRVVPSDSTGPGRPESHVLQLHPDLDSHTRYTSYSSNPGNKGVSGISGMPTPDDAGLRGRIGEVGSE